MYDVPLSRKEEGFKILWMQTHLAHLANTASLTEGADSPHIALVPGTKLGRVVVGGGIQGNAWMHIPSGLQVVALTEQREKWKSKQGVGL